jgi:hypothetical protein
MMHGCRCLNCRTEQFVRSMLVALSAFVAGAVFAAMWLGSAPHG